MPWSVIGNIKGAQGNNGLQGTQGVKGDKGDQGIQGPIGIGVPTGGTTNQHLMKQSNTDYDFAWGTPAGGVTIPLSQNLTWTPDATYDIGATSTTLRPRDLFLSRDALIGGTLGVTGAASFSSTVLLAADPTLNLQAATKQYADTKLTQAQGDARYQTPAQAAALYLPLTGGTLTGNLLFSTDNLRDIGASGATRPRDLYLGRNALVAGTLTLGGTATVRANGADFQSDGALIAGNGYLFVGSQKDVMWHREGPSDISLVGRAGIDNVWAKTNLSIGAAPLAGKQVVIGSSGEYIRNPVNALNNLSIESSDGWVAMGGKSGGYVLGNAYNDGTNWQRFDVAAPATLVTLNSLGINFYNAPAAANPISWITAATIDLTGKLTLNAGLAVSAGAVSLPNGSITTPMIAANAVTQSWGLQAAPGGTTTSTTDTAMPGQFGSGLSLTGYSGGRLLIIAKFEFQYNAGSGQSARVSLLIDGVDQNTRAGTAGVATGAYCQIFFVYQCNVAAGARNISFNWYTSGGTLAMNTGIYSELYVTEFMK